MEPGPSQGAVIALDGGRLLPGSMIVAAHPDDETIGAGALISRSIRCTVIHLTDGAPLDRNLWPVRLRHLGRGDYAALRRRESERALRLAGLRAERIVHLEAIDQEAMRELPRLAQTLRDAFRTARPPMVVVHAYEGGHPDHDAASLAAHAAAALVADEGEAPPALVEMTSYHGCGGAPVTSAFIPDDAGTEVVLPLSRYEAALKERMLAMYVSQAEALAGLPLAEQERFRFASRPDFLRPPHQGPLWYERQGWMRGEAWRSAAGEALRALHLSVERWR